MRDLVLLVYKSCDSHVIISYRRLSDQIIQHSDNVHVDQQEQVETTPVHKPLPLNEAFIHKLKQLQSLLDVNGYASTMYGEQK